MSSYVSRLFPPYYKYAVFLFIGFQFIYCAFVLAISEAYYKSATLILPIAYRMFDDTVKKNVPAFHWTQEDRHELEMVLTLDEESGDVIDEEKDTPIIYQ